jgi:hypothetical protein
MKYFYSIILLLSLNLIYSQSGSRILLSGQVKCDSLNIENVVVFNVNSRSGCVVKKNGVFEINAKVLDTLVISSLNFFTKKIILNPEDFQQNPFIIKLLLKINNLDEVKVFNNNDKYSPIKENTQKYVDKQFIDDEKSHLVNQNVYTGVITNGADFVRLFKDVVKLFKKKNPTKIDYFADISFTELVLRKVKYIYFINTLKLKDDEIRLFLIFCENDENAKDLSRYKSTFELMDFLFNKNKEFSTIKNSIK